MGTKKWNRPGSSFNSEYRGLYQSWRDIFGRISNKDGRYQTYSDVSICDRWLSYDNFFDDMSDTWFKGATLDKDIIKPGNRVYCKEYCKWVSKAENTKERNNRCRSSNNFFTDNPMYNDEIMSKRTGKNHPSARKVKCIETGKIYNYCREAAIELNLPKCSISNAANPNCLQKTAGGYHWEYVG